MKPERLEDMTDDGKEKIPTIEEINFEQSLILAKNLKEAITNRNNFVEGFGGSDVFYSAIVHIDDNRKRYDALQAKYDLAKEAFDHGVKDRKKLVKKLRSVNENELADFLDKNQPTLLQRILRI
jgi:uncharacterized radical SAM superfamily Fe-S cluster-containing enzyme